VIAAFERVAQSGRYPVRRLAGAVNQIEARAAALDRALLKLHHETDRTNHSACIKSFRALHRALTQAVALLDADDAAWVQPYCDDAIREAIVAVTALADNSPPA
jgi:hypothetical protein